MSKQFQGSMNYEGISAVADLKDHLTLVWSHSTGFERAQQGLLLAYMYFLEGEYPEADLPIRDYVSASEERYGQYSNQVRCGLILLSNNYIGWGLQEDSQSVLERLKVVSQRCPSFDADPLLEGLYGSAVGCLNADGPTNEQRGFIPCLMALSWCVRYQSDTRVYAEYAPRLKSIFEAYGFVDDRWEWLAQSCKHNLHDLLGLISILLEKRLLPSDAQPRLTTEMREEVLKSLVQEFPLHEKTELRERILNASGHPTVLRFTCPMCGSQDLRTKFLEPYYPISTLDRIKVDPGNVDLCDLQERNPSEYEGAGHTDGWEFWCDKCHLVPRLEPYDDEESAEESLARWLLDNCPQDDGLPAIETAQPKE
jgi:hypothetical protein